MSHTQAALRLHVGAIDQSMITSRSPPEVMKHVTSVLQSMGVQIQIQSEYKYRCIRPQWKAAAVEEPGAQEFGDPCDTANPSTPHSTPFLAPTAESILPATEPVYGDPTQELGGEVRFSVEITKLSNLEGTYSLDIRRLKGNLRSYKFVYDTLRDRVELH